MPAHITPTTWGLSETSLSVTFNDSRKIENPTWEGWLFLRNGEGKFEARPSRVGRWCDNTHCHAPVYETVHRPTAFHNKRVKNIQCQK